MGLYERRNAHRNERLTRVGVEGKMPMEPHFEREAVDRSSWPSLVISRKLGAFYRSDIPSRAVRSLRRRRPKASFAPDFAEERRGEPTAGRGILRGWHTVRWKSGLNRKLSTVLSIAIS